MVERFEVTGNPESGKPEMVRSPNPLGGGWVRYFEVESLIEAIHETFCDDASCSRCLHLKKAIKPLEGSQ